MDSIQRPGRALRAALSVSLFALAPLAAAQDYATQVVTYNQGTGGGIFTPANVLGGPQGGGFGLGSLDVLSLGVGGDLTLGFDVTLRDGPGADFTAFENGFVVGGTAVFAEVTYVEVSTDGATFARFPSSYGGLPGGSSDMGTFAGLCGGLPVLANVAANPIDPFDPVESGGEAFDLAELASDPAVLAGQVDVQAIHFVRFVDVLSELDVDSQGVPIWDGPGADLDAVAVLNSDQNATATQPVCDLSLDASGHLRLVLGDPDGFGDLDLGQVRASIDLQPISPVLLLPIFDVASATPTEFTLVSKVPVAGSGVLAALAFSVRDLGGERSADQIMLQG